MKDAATGATLRLLREAKTSVGGRAGAGGRPSFLLNTVSFFEACLLTRERRQMSTVRNYNARTVNAPLV